MIRVERSRVPRPAILDSDAAERERRNAERHFTDASRDRQQRFPFRIYRHPSVRDAINTLFHAKCAYCETRITAFAPLDVELFRPKGSVTERPEHPGYWWLAGAWDNMLSACEECNRVRLHAGERAGKGSRFPLEDEASRAFAPGQEAGERPLLLNPCRDDPEKHLIFDESGEVISDTPRGQASISVLGLNRKQLVAARRAAATAVQALVADFESVLSLMEEGARRPSRAAALRILQAELDALHALAEPAQEFAALKRQLVAPLLRRMSQAGIAPDPPDTLKLTPRITASRRVAARAAHHAYLVRQSRFSLDDAEGRDRYRSERRLIERVTIHNVRAIRDFDLDLTGLGGGRTPWLMLLGENGTGKSTILQSIALTLCGAETFARLGRERKLHPGDYIRYRCRSGSVTVKLSGFVGPHRVDFHPDRAEFHGPTGERATVTFGDGDPIVTGAGWQPQTILLGYGATRLLPRGGGSGGAAPGGDTFSRIDNLFDPFVPLHDAEAWLTGLTRSEFASAAVVLKDLLRLGADASLVVENGRVQVVEHDAKVPLRHVSDGYQSVVATACDVLEVAMRLWPNLMDAEGVVVLDEIGAHLHPSWKMRIVGSIRRAVPGIQFIGSTHDPLCLRGLGAGEVVVMQRDDAQRVRDLQGLPSPGDFRIDQLLTSDFFGLSSTVDPETEELFDEYYALLALRRRTAAQARRLEALRQELKDRRHLGTTMRENLMYEAVDRLVARHRVDPSTPLPALKQEAADDIARIWEEPDAQVPSP